MPDNQSPRAKLAAAALRYTTEWLRYCLGSGLKPAKVRIEAAEEALIAAAMEFDAAFANRSDADSADPGLSGLKAQGEPDAPND